MFASDQDSLPSIHILGRVPYEAALVRQREAARAVQAGTCPGVFFLLEHDPVITLGANRPINRVVCPPPDVPVIQTDRGGGATVHNPGQLVLYPVVSLPRLDLGVKAFVAWLLERGRELLACYGVTAVCRLDPLGLWVGPRKIASMGIHVARGVVTHGLAVNVANDLRLFQSVVPCGLEGVVMTSVQAETGQVVPLEGAMHCLRALLEAALAGDFLGEDEREDRGDLF